MNDKDMSVFTDEFTRACELIVKYLPIKPFSVRGPFNTSIFDSIFCTLMKHVGEIKEDIEARYYRLIENDEFVELTTLATTDTKIVKRRFDLVERELFG